jgi:hypothetical protein
MSPDPIGRSATCPPKPGGRGWKREGGPIRYVSGLVFVVAALVTLLGGGLMMVRELERGAYGTASIDRALTLLAAGGGFLAIGISLLIWEVSVRHNIRH